jgi:hypothetical protein
MYCDRGYGLRTVPVPVLGETDVLVRTTDFTLIARQVGISPHGHLDACNRG